jgi:hypothetical protein
LNDNRNDSNYIEYYMLNAWWVNDWISTCFCRMSGMTFGPNTTYNVYKLKGLFFCGLCFETLEKRHKEKGVILNAELYWESLQSSPELQ